MSTPAVQLNGVQVEQGEGGLVTLQIEVAPSSVKQTRDSIIRDYARRVKIAGFRPGRAPANIVRRTVGDDTILQALSDKVVQDAYRQALEENSLRPLNQAQVSDLELDGFDDEKPASFKASVILRPEITLGDIKSIELSSPKVEATDEQVEEALQGLREESATLKNVEGRDEAQEGDVLNAELQVFIDGEAKGDEPAQLRAFVLGESGFVPEIDSHLIGAKLDEERRFEVSYPEDFHHSELAGKSAEFAVKVTAIQEKVLPELNDEYAVSMGSTDVAAMRERMKMSIIQSQENQNRARLREEITEKVAELSELEVPAELVRLRVEDRIHQLQHELQDENKTFEAWLEEEEKTREELEDELQKEFTATTRRELILDEIADKEGLKVKEEEFSEYYMQMAQLLEQPIETLIERLDAQAVHTSLLRRKAIDWLLEQVTITETEAPEAGDETESEAKEDTKEEAQPAATES